MKVIVLTGGGTSGHVTPNIALIPRLKKLGYTIHYIGSKNGIEKQLIQNEKIPYHEISAGKLRRYLDFQNVTDLFRIISGFSQSLKILRKVKPNIVFSKGGFVSCPVVWASWVRRIPVIIHESDITPGLTNRLSTPFARKICYTFPESGKFFPADKRYLTGLPVREEIKLGNRVNGYKHCGFSGSKPVIMVIGGSQGSENINTVVRSVLPTLIKTYHVCHICGKGNVKPELEGLKGYKQFEYVSEQLPDLFAAADLIVSRAGATTLFEILAVKKPAILIPLSKSASRGDQILNAKSFKNRGYSEVIPEEDLSGERLAAEINRLYQNKSKYIKAMQQNPSFNSIDKLIDLIQEVTLV